MTNIGKSGNLELIANNNSSKENLLHIGIEGGNLCVFCNDGNRISGVISVEILSEENSLTTVNIKVLVNKKFFISDSIIVRGE